MEGVNGQVVSEHQVYVVVMGSSTPVPESQCPSTPVHLKQVTELPPQPAMKFSRVLLMTQLFNSVVKVQLNKNFEVIGMSCWVSRTKSEGWRTGMLETVGCPRVCCHLGRVSNKIVHMKMDIYTNSCC